MPCPSASRAEHPCDHSNLLLTACNQHLLHLACCRRASPPTLTPLWDGLVDASEILQATETSHLASSMTQLADLLDHQADAMEACFEQVGSPFACTSSVLQLIRAAVDLPHAVPHLVCTAACRATLRRPHASNCKGGAWLSRATCWLALGKV